MRAFEVQGTLAIDHHAGAAGPHEDVAALGRRNEFHLVAQTVTTATRNRDPQVTPLPFSLNQLPDFRSRCLGHVDEVLVSFANAFRQSIAVPIPRTGGS